MLSYLKNMEAFMDLQIVEWFQGLSNGFFDAFFGLITEFGGDLVFLVVGTLLFWLYDKRFGYRFMTLFLFTLGLNDIFKNFIQRPRPFVADNAESIGEETYGYAMPSAHSSNAGIMALVLNERFGKLKKFITPTLFTMMVLVGLSRVYLGQHYLSDVMMGFLLAAVVFYFYRRYDSLIEENATIVISSALGLLLLFMIIFGVFYDTLGIDSTESFRNLYIAFGSILGLSLGHKLELKYVKYSEKAPWFIQIAKYVIGLIVALIIQEGFKRVLPYPDTQTMLTVILDSIRYFLLTLWLSLGALATFKALFKQFEA